MHRRATLYLGTYASVGGAPDTTGGVELGGAAIFRHFSIGAELRGDMPVAVDRGVGRIQEGRLFVEALPCFRTIAFGFGVCALAAVGLTVARGLDYPVSRTAFVPYVAFGARLLVEIPLVRRVALGLHGDVLGLVTRASLHAENSDAYVDAPATGAFGMNVVYRFGDGS
jgi:hypothetical protein